MENKAIAHHLQLLSDLMEVHDDQHPFKTKSIAEAAFKINHLTFPVSNKTIAELNQMNGIGKSIVAKIIELIQTGTLEDLEDLLNKTPLGLIEILKIKGIGPKKVHRIWKDLGIENVEALYEACQQNRLISVKGFGSKIQEEIKNTIEFNVANKDLFLYAKVEKFAEDLLKQLQIHWPAALISYIGDYRRRCEVISSLDILWTVSVDSQVLASLKHIDLVPYQFDEESVQCKNKEGISVNLINSPIKDFGWNLIMHTGNKRHVDSVKKLLGTQKIVEQSAEQAIYRLAGLAFIEPELREGNLEIKLGKTNQLPHLIEFKDLKGALHNHTTWSDGIHSLEEMASFCRNELKLEYLGICDHSKSAFYAKGLNEKQVLLQQEEIAELNRKLKPFYIFKGIESDILFDGSLDYADDILRTFDFVVASIHAVLKMDERKATDRLIKAIENPFTTILGHPTGRLLGKRAGYNINYKKVIEACAANQVVMEINANPLRLDLDWRWHQYAIEKNVLLSINPDAHRKEGLLDMHYGILVARKGGVTKKNCLNTFTLAEIKAFFQAKKEDKY